MLCRWCYGGDCYARVMRDVWGGEEIWGLGCWTWIVLVEYMVWLCVWVWIYTAHMTFGYGWVCILRFALLQCSKFFRQWCASSSSLFHPHTSCSAHQHPRFPLLRSAQTASIPSYILDITALRRLRCRPLFFSKAHMDYLVLHFGKPNNPRICRKNREEKLRGLSTRRR